MRRLIFCCDGTWNHIESAYPTNVLKLARAIPGVADDGVSQVVFYLEGVGTGRGTGSIAKKIDRLGGGMFGWGLLQNVVEAYKNLMFNYRPGDEIYIFGFSRGAHTARSLAGMIRSVGILDRDRIHMLPEAIKRYQNRGTTGHPDTPENCAFRWENSRGVTTGSAEREWRKLHHPETDLAVVVPLKIAYLGVWDTVGAMGVPSFLWISKLFNRKYTFHDFALSSSVASARHAIAIDERRATFPAAPWDNLDELNARRPEGEALPYQQLWFPGDHGSVGGGGDITGLSDDALLWVAEGAMAKGLQLHTSLLDAAAKTVDHTVPLVNISAQKWSFTSLAMSMVTKDRSGPQLLSDVAPSARKR
ncbi:MAG: DUF2235 domain-containing protein [Candidatus Devosia phytovorans]|uniref:DUF2235 domain-containing protein n=1 Tax=Candidatus Devosia phytovorans TaxID=3121372 RepID=A0AAJ5VWB5_9HYPH|nr:DUF2235 domain-containing protein [Devosia sp.]WEK04593.1 MAG: DUF2235 domain-containing protein [Devosia sp.]